MATKQSVRIIKRKGRSRKSGSGPTRKTRRVKRITQRSR